MTVDRVGINRPIVMIGCLIIIFLSLFNPPESCAQVSGEFTMQSPSYVRYNDIGLATQAPGFYGNSVMPESSLSSVVVGTIYRTILGVSAGIAIGYLLNSDAEESWIGVTDEMLAGAVVGSTLGSSVGAYSANDRKGQVFMAFGANAVIATLAIVIAEKDPMIAITFPLFQIGSSVAVIRLTD